MAKFAGMPEDAEVIQYAGMPEGAEVVDLPQKPKAPNISTPDDVPEWGRKNPNLYGLYGAGRALTRAGIEGIGTALGAAGGFAAGGGVGSIPGAGLGYAGSKRLADYVLGPEDNQEPDSIKSFAKDVALGSVMQVPGAALATRPVRAALAALPQKLPQTLYESAMKFSNNPNVLSPVARRQAIETGLAGDFRPNEKSYERLWATVNANKSKTNKIIDDGEAAGDVIDTVRALRPLDKIRQRFDIVRSKHPELAEAVDDVYNRYSQSPTMPVKEAQTLKETLQDLATFATDDRSKATNRAYKAVGRGLRIELERLYPDLAKINKESSSLLTLENELAKAVGRVGNRDLTSLGLRVALSGQPSATGITNAALSIFEMPRIKARIATTIYKAQTGRNIPVSQWRKVAGKVFAPAVAGATGAKEQANRDNYKSQIEQAVLGYTYENGELIPQ